MEEKNRVSSCEIPADLVVEKGDQITLLLTGLSCASCVAKVQKALEQVANVKEVRVNLADSTALIWGKNPDEKQCIEAVEKIGYGAEAIQDDKMRRHKQQEQVKKALYMCRWQSLTALFVGFSLMGWSMWQGLDIPRQLLFVLGLFVLGVMILTGKHFYQQAWINLRQKNATMDTLVSLGTISAWIYSMLVVCVPDFFPTGSRHLYFDASVMILGLINLGKMLELKGKQQSSKALERLLDLTPAYVIEVSEIGEKRIPLSQVNVGMILRLQTGERVAVDGIVTQGTGWVDESMLTGEAKPLEKHQGERLSAGTILTDGSVCFRAERVGKHTRLAHIIQLVRQAQSSKPPIGQLVDKIAGVFVPMVIGIALTAGCVWYIFTQNFSYSFIVFTSVLIIACPCALGLATPMSIIAGVGRSAELGVLVRNADSLQRAASVDTLVFDKTGTLTQGQPAMTAFYTFNGTNKRDVLQLAGSLEQGASHPLAKAILTNAQAKALSLFPIEQFHTIKGQGVLGKIQGKELILGNEALMQQHQVDIHLALAQAKRERQQGATVIFFAIDGILSGLFCLSDPLRADTSAGIARLKALGFRIIMLTGDEPHTAKFIAKEAGIEEVIAGVMPEGKVRVIADLQKNGKQVAMVGDGINDAPALALADVSVAMGGGADVAIETAELTLMRPSLNALTDALLLARAVLRNIKENLFGAFIYNLICIPLACGVFYPLWGELINPMWGALAMALSSTTVVLNANRLLRFKVK